MYPLTVGGSPRLVAVGVYSLAVGGSPPLVDSGQIVTYTIFL